jgi:YidC/Oxa1 family membrane protein insertase
LDIKRFILSMTLVLAVFLGWQLFLGYLNKQHPEWHLTTPATQPADTASTQASQPAVASATTAPSTQPAAIVAGPAAAAPGDASAASIGSNQHADPQWAMQLTIDPLGAGLDSAVLNDFYETAEKKNLYQFQTPLDTDLPTRPLGSRQVIVNGQTVDLSGPAWTQGDVSATAATYKAIVKTGGAATLEIDKTFQLLPRNASNGSGGFELAVSQVFKNLSPGPLKLQTTFNGTTLPPRESDRSDDRGFVAGYDDDREVAESATPITYFSTSHPDKDLVQVDNRPLLWAGASSAYFDAIVRPDYTGQTAKNAIRIAAVPISAVNPDAPADNRTAAMTLQTADFTVAPGAAANLNLKIFLGPKKRELLKNAYFSAYPLSFNTTLITTGGWCGFLTFAPLINLLYGILWLFHAIFRDWGIAIICLVVLVRTLLHPITRKSQVNMLQMGKMGPELERLKKKHADDKDELNKAMMQFYKQQGFTPILGCLPMFLQTPIWIALWSALQSTFELRQAPFLRFGWLHLTWIKDLSHPDALIHLANPIVLPFGWQLHGLNVLPLLLAVVFFLQQKTMPRPVATTPEQAQQQKMMQWMSLLFPVMLYAGPSGLNLYILTSTTIGIIESKIIRDHIKQREAAEKAGRIIVDAKPTRASKRRDSQQPPKEPKGKIMGFLADLQAKAEEIRRDAERKGR